MNQHLSCGIQKGKHVFIASLLVPNSAIHSLCWTSFSCEPQQVQNPQSLWHRCARLGYCSTVISNGHQQYIQGATDSAVPMQGNAACSWNNSTTSKLLHLLSCMLLNPLHQGGLVATEREEVILQVHLPTPSRAGTKACSMNTSTCVSAWHDVICTTCTTSSDAPHGAFVTKTLGQGGGSLAVDSAC